MNLGDIKPIPGGFLNQLLRAFGIEWTHLVILSGVAFSSFGLQGYVNPGIWILGTVMSFSIVYLFRWRITGNFPKVFVWTGLSILVGLALPAFVLFKLGQEIPAFLRASTDIATAYLSMVVGIPVGIGILSYRAQDEFLRTPLPGPLENAVKDSVLNSDFIHERADYEIEFRKGQGDEVVMHFNVVMHVENRLKQAATYRDIFDPAGRNKSFQHAEIDGSSINQQDPERLSLRGLHLSYDAAAGQKFRVAVSGASTFHGRDSELVGVYFPCAQLSLLIRKPPSTLQVHVQSLLRRKVDPKTLPNGDLTLEWREGLLPFQGVRLFWEPS